MGNRYSGGLWIWKNHIIWSNFNRHGMWQMLRVSEGGGKLLNAVQSYYVDSKACFDVGYDLSKWFPVNVGLRQGCVMSPWLFNVYMDDVVQEMNVRVLVKKNWSLQKKLCMWHAFLYKNQ